MKKIRVGINGLGRIGRVFSRLCVLNSFEIELVQINDLSDIHVLAHLLKYDSIHGKFSQMIRVEGDEILMGNQRIKVTSEKEIEKINWGNKSVDFVIDSTGINLEKSVLLKHIQSGAKRVILSAPSKTEDIKNIVYGINHTIINKNDIVLSNSSCTSNATAQLIYGVITQKIKIQSLYISTIHSYTNDQRLQDFSHKDFRRARAGGLSIVPTTTGAVRVMRQIFPELKNKIYGIAYRVPIPNASIIDLLITTDTKVDADVINRHFKNLAESDLKGVLGYTNDPIVSVDVIGNSLSCLFDSQLTTAMGNMIKISGWYDNEYGYSSRLIDLIKYVSTL